MKRRLTLALALILTMVGGTIAQAGQVSTFVQGSVTSVCTSDPLRPCVWDFVAAGSQRGSIQVMIQGGVLMSDLGFSFDMKFLDGTELNGSSPIIGVWGSASTYAHVHWGGGAPSPDANGWFSWASLGAPNIEVYTPEGGTTPWGTNSWADAAAVFAAHNSRVYDFEVDFYQVEANQHVLLDNFLVTGLESGTYSVEPECVPDPGSSLFLLGMSLVALRASRKRGSSRRRMRQ
jgi:hypothetical protein